MEEGALTLEQRANARWKEMLSAYKAPPMGDRSAEALDDYVARRKSGMADEWLWRENGSAGPVLHSGMCLLVGQQKGRVIQASPWYPVRRMTGTDRGGSSRTDVGSEEVPWPTITLQSFPATGSGRRSCRRGYASSRRRARNMESRLRSMSFPGAARSTQRPAG